MNITETNADLDFKKPDGTDYCDPHVRLRGSILYYSILRFRCVSLADFKLQ